MKKGLLKLVAMAAFLLLGGNAALAQTVYGLTTASWMEDDVYFSGIQTASVDLASLDPDSESPAELTLGDMKIAGYDILAATGAGTKFYAFLANDIDGSEVATTCFCTVNFETGEVVRVNSTSYGNDENRKAGNMIDDLAFDESSETLYAIEHVYDDAAGETVTALYTVDTETGALTRVGAYDSDFFGIAVKDGKMYMPTIKTTWEGSGVNSRPVHTFSLYEVGADGGVAVTPLIEQGISALSAKCTMAFAADGTLYMQMSTQTYAIDLDAKTIALKGQLNKALYGLSFTKSSENGVAGAGDSGEEETPLTRLLVRSTKFGDHMGNGIGIDMQKTEYFYNSDYKLSRVVESARGYDGDVPADYCVTYLYKYNYNENNLLADIEKWQTGVYDFGDMAYKLSSTTNYEYDENGRLLSEPVSYYIYYYEYDDEGNVVKATAKNSAGKAVQVFEYSDFVGKNKPTTIVSTSPEPTWTSYFYTSTCTYDANGNKTEELRTNTVKASDGVTDSTVYVQRETWTYDGKFLCKYQTNQFSSAGVETPYFKTVYVMVDDNPNVIMHSDSTFRANSKGGGTWYGSGNPYIDEYVDFSGMSEKMAVNGLKAELVSDALNTVKLTFPVPAIANSPGRTGVNIYRKGELIATKVIGVDTDLVINNYATLSYTDSTLYNGDYEYFVQPFTMPYVAELAEDGGDEGVDDGDLGEGDDSGEIEVETVGYNISNIAEISVNLPLPAVTDLKYGEQRQDEKNQIFVKISWTNPTYPEDYGFISNNLHFVNYQIADTTTVDPASTWLEGSFYGDASVFVLTRYKYGKAISDTIDVKLIPVGIESVPAASGAAISFNGKDIRLSENAAIAVYSAAGKLEAKEADANGISLGHLNSGVYIVCVTRDGVTTAHKVVVR